MIGSKFKFFGKIFILYFFIINIYNFFPVNLFNLNYYIILTTTIYETSTLLFIGTVISKYSILKQLSTLDQLDVNELGDSSYKDKINSLRIKNFRSKKISYVISILFLVLTLFNPILILLDFNRNDIFITNFKISIEKDYNIKKQQIEELIITGEEMQADTIQLNKLEDRIKDLSIQKEKRLSDFLQINNQNKFKNTKLIVRNFFLGLLFILAFYKLYLL